MVRFLEHPADLSHALPRPTVRHHAGHDSHREYGSGGLGNADRGIGSKRRERRAALDDARGCLTARRRGGACHRESLRRPAEARQAGPGIAALGAVSYPGGQSVVAMNLYLYGDQAAATVARETPVWQAWLQERFPTPTEIKSE